MAMAESTCLMQTFSHTSDNSHEAKEGNPIRVLGESISFGRFVSESLSWEKWSSFSHNRYLEEAEKYSKPGSVAQKKAYFEAHYRKIAAKKAAEAALLEQENASNKVCKLESKNEIHDGASLDSELVGSNTHVAIDEPQETEVLKTGSDYNVDVDGSNSNVEMDDTIETIKVDRAAPIVKDQILEENLVLFESTNHFTDSKNSNKVTKIERNRTVQMKRPIKVSQENSTSKKELASAIKIKPVVSSSKPSVNARASKIPSSPAKYMTPIHPRKEKSAVSNSKKCARDSLDKKKMTPKSLHMSLNFAPPNVGNTSKVYHPIIQKFENSRVAGNGSSFKASNDCKTPLRTPYRASVNGLQKVPSLTPQSENKRTRTELVHTLSGSRKVDAKWQSLSVDRSKSASALRNKTQSSIVSSPFNFRTDERASKRKEKLEEKFNAKEARKLQLQSILEEKAEVELKKLRQSLGFKARPMPDFYRKKESTNNQIKKIQPTRPRSPKFVRKPSSGTVQEKSPLPPRNPSVNRDDSKHIMEKKRTPIRIFDSFPKKNTYENTSPNIQY